MIKVTTTPIKDGRGNIVKNKKTVKFCGLTVYKTVINGCQYLGTNEVVPDEKSFL